MKKTKDELQNELTDAQRQHDQEQHAEKALLRENEILAWKKKPTQFYQNLRDKLGDLFSTKYSVKMVNRKRESQKSKKNYWQL